MAHYHIFILMTQDTKIKLYGNIDCKYKSLYNKIVPWSKLFIQHVKNLQGVKSSSIFLLEGNSLSWFDFGVFYSRR